MLGTDIIEVSRIEKILNKPHATAFLHRVYTEAELKYCLREDKKKYNTPSLASRFCAKEATMKVLGEGFGTIEWKEIEVTRNSSGKPGISLTGKAKKLAEKLGYNTIELSMSHTENYATAVALGK